MFHWKRHRDIWKGEGIYHLTFVLRERRPVMGRLLNEGAPRVELTNEGILATRAMSDTQALRPNIRFYAKQVMPDHIHVLIHVQQDSGETIKELARGMRQGWYKQSPLLDFAPPYIRTLAHKGQLDAMFKYIHDNPRRAIIRQQHPDLFYLRRNLPATRGDLTLSFSAMGNMFLLDYPTRQVVRCSRSLTEEQIAATMQAVLDNAAATGCVSYSGAISRGEQAVMRAVREQQFPMVIILKDGFPQPGTPHERYYKPGGVYYDACAAGRLLLLEPTPETAAHPAICALTEQELRARAAAHHQDYRPLPPTSTRWQMMRNNIIAAWLAGS